MPCKAFVRGFFNTIITKKAFKRFNSMTVINPNNTTHTLNVVPRYYPSNDLVISLYNESSKVTSTPVNTYNINDGKLSITFTFTFVDKDRHQVKITDAYNVVYRGKLLTTTQDPQKFKQTEGLYFYS